VVEDPTYFAPMCQQLTYIGTGPNGEPSDCAPDIQCNDATITQAPNCTGKPNYIAYTIVTFTLTNTPPDTWTYDVPGCSSPVGAEVNKFQCNLPGPYTASAQGSCADLNSCVSACPSNYNKVGDKCVWDGSGTDGKACLTGADYDPTNQCCTAVPAVAVNFDFCPAGFYPLGDTCVKEKVLVDTELQPVIFDMDNCHLPVRQPRTPDECTAVEPLIGLGGCRKFTGGNAPFWNPLTCTCVPVPP
jgi:hypothetical protein